MGGCASTPTTQPQRIGGPVSRPVQQQQQPPPDTHATSEYCQRVNAQGRQNTLQACLRSCPGDTNPCVVGGNTFVKGGGMLNSCSTAYNYPERFVEEQEEMAAQGEIARLRTFEAAFWRNNAFPTELGGQPIDFLSIGFVNDGHYAPNLAAEVRNLITRTFFTPGNVVLGLQFRWIPYDANIRNWNTNANLILRDSDLLEYRNGTLQDRRNLAPVVRISFNPNGGFWAGLGRSILFAERQQPTMNLGFRANQQPQARAGITRHEFCHVLGLVHEHQREDYAGTIPWANKQAIYDWFYCSQGWTPAQVEKNWFRQWEIDTGNSTIYDPYSIMQYVMDCCLFSEDPGFPCNGQPTLWRRPPGAGLRDGSITELSPADVHVLRRQFPPPPGTYDAQRAEREYREYIASITPQFVRQGGVVDSEQAVQTDSQQEGFPDLGGEVGEPALAESGLTGSRLSVVREVPALDSNSDGTAGNRTQNPPLSTAQETTEPSSYGMVPQGSISSLAHPYIMGEAENRAEEWGGHWVVWYVLITFIIMLLLLLVVGVFALLGEIGTWVTGRRPGSRTVPVTQPS